MHNLAPKYFQITPDYGASHGSYLLDKQTGKTYLDVMMMFSSLPLGYNHKIFDSNFENDLAKICRQKISNTVFQNEYENELSENLAKSSGFENFHFCSTGALAVESAIKAAIYKSRGKKTKVLSIANSFHGINAWGMPTDRHSESIKTRLHYFPSFNWPISSIEKVVQTLEESSDLAALIIEPIQCTTGDIFLPLDILRSAVEICKRKGICVIFDEIQTGMGSTGHYWYSLGNNLKPDIIIFGKKVQVSGIMLSQEFSEILSDKSFPLSVTYDGDLIDMLRANYVFKAIKKFNYLENIQKQSAKIINFLEKMGVTFRAAGSIIAFDFSTTDSRDSFVSQAFKSQMLLNKGGTKTIRMRPNLAITDEETNHVISSLEKVFNESTY